MKLLLIITTFLLSYIGLEQLVEKSTCGFWDKRIQATDLATQPEFDTETPAEIEEILSQPFHLLGSGSECFAFESADGQTVLKVFKLDKFRPVYLNRGLLREDYSDYAGVLSALPHVPSWLEKAAKRVWGIREYRLQRTFLSQFLSHKELQEETALFYSHLNPTKNFTTPLTLYDSSHIAHTLDPNELRFVLQKKATPMLKHFDKLLRANAHEDAKRSIDSFLTLLTSRCQKGFSDRDSICRNFGYLQTQAIEIDTGSFAKNPHMKEQWIFSQEIYYATLELKAWLKPRAPELAKYLEQEVDRIIS